MFDYPLFKYACAIARCSRHSLVIRYRQCDYEISLSGIEKVDKVLHLMDGHHSIEEIASLSSSSISAIRALVNTLAEIPLVVNGQTVIRQDRLMSGEDLFWRLEALMFKWRFNEFHTNFSPSLEEQIASGKAPESVVKGFCIEICHQVMNAPTEIATAIASSPNDKVRSLFMEFYDEESEHGSMLVDALTSWTLTKEQIITCTPLPTTIGLINTYNQWAQKDVLMYATALMRDEQSSLDAKVPNERDIYAGMEKHYSVPSKVIDTFRWHANLDREAGHGFFPQQVFSQYEIIDEMRVLNIVSALRLIIDLYNTFASGIVNYYSYHDPTDRMSLNRELNKIASETHFMTSA